ncbi:MAG: hypothetical protein HYU63_02020 [Armatimonadetes bacterium]|nr:hypothetical protein [Armatimonadota bacterium]
MVTAKLCKIIEDCNLEDIGKKLEKYDKTETEISDDGHKVNLRTNTKDITHDRKKIRGVIYVDYIACRKYRGEKEYYPANVFSEFYVKKYGDSYYVFIFACHIKP